MKNPGKEITPIVTHMLLAMRKMYHMAKEKIQNCLLPVVHQKRCFLVKKGMPCHPHTVGYKV